MTIFPWVKDLPLWSLPFSLIKNPSSEDYKHVLRVGEASIWPYLSRIRANCRVEMTLDRCVHRLRKRMASEGGAVSPSKERAGSSPRLQSRNRIPSFYSERQLVNISGLSVTDPFPAASGDDYYVNDGEEAGAELALDSNVQFSATESPMKR